MNLKTLTRLLWRRLWLLLATAVACALLVWGGLRLSGDWPRFSATAVVAIGGDIFDAGENADVVALADSMIYMELADSMIANYRHLATREIVTAAVKKELDLEETPAEIADNLTLAVIDDTNLLAIEAHHANPAIAAAIANAVARQLTTFSPLPGANFVMPVESAPIPLVADSGLLIPVLMAGFVGLLLSLGGVLLLAYVRQPITSEDDVAEWLDLPTLLTLAPRWLASWRWRRGQSVVRGDTAVWYALHTTCRRLWRDKAGIDSGPPLVLVTSPTRSASRTLVANRLAQTWAAAAPPVVLADLGDTRRRLPEPDLPEDALQRLGPDNWPLDAALASQQAAAAQLAQARDDNQTVIVNALPPSTAVQTIMAAQEADLVLLVVESWATTAAQARETLALLAQNGVVVDGVVVSRWQTRHGSAAWLTRPRRTKRAASAGREPEHSAQAQGRLT